MGTMQAISKAATRTMSVLHPSFSLLDWYGVVFSSRTGKLLSAVHVFRRALKLVSFAIIIKEKRNTGTHMLSGFDTDSRCDKCLLLTTAYA